MNILGLILARGGSKGLPRKNVLPLAGKPLIAWTIAAARQSRHLTQVILSSDDEEIAQAAREWDCEVPFMRPPELARDDSTAIDVAEHALRWAEIKQGRLPDYLFLLQPTSPLRTATDIDTAIELALERRAPAVLGVCEASPHPYLARTVQPDGTLGDFFDFAGQRPPRRQDYPPAFVINGAVYVNHVATLLETRTFQPAGSLPYVMTAERSLDIDTAWDLALAEIFLRGSSPQNFA